jgi:hypothetical protein
VFYHQLMASIESDRIIVARLSGASSRLSVPRHLDAAERQRALDELREIVGGRADLLAQHAGVCIGSNEGELDEEMRLREAQLCIDAGADMSLIPAWIDEGRRRRAERDNRLRRAGR